MTIVWQWFAGIIESDDIQVITTEVDKCLNFSRKCQMLIDNVKKKYHDRYVRCFRHTVKSTYKELIGIMKICFL